MELVAGWTGLWIIIDRVRNAHHVLLVYLSVALLLKAEETLYSVALYGRYITISDMVIYRSGNAADSAEPRRVGTARFFLYVLSDSLHS